jgi:aminoglycoside phosphotransferase (APT) family kinase protein
MTAFGDEGQLARKIAAYLSGQTGHAVQVGQIKRFPVGFSWLTYAVPVSGLKGGEQELILRLGPDYGLFAPYSAGPQELSMRSLEGSAVPLPRAYWSSDDANILGAPFLFCEKVSGTAVVPWVTASQPELEPAYRQGLALDFVDILAALHRVPWAAKPIAQLAQGINEGNAALRSVVLWEAHIKRWQMRAYPLAEWGIRWLKSNAPAAPFVAIVHGDYRTGNFLEQNGRITSILDWELVHLGDPHEDLGWASLPMYMGGSKLISRLAEPDWFYARYSEKAGFQVSMASVRYYQALSLLKLAATHMAAARCFEEGRFNDMRMPAMGSQIATCLRQMEKIMTQSPAS